MPSYFLSLVLLTGLVALVESIFWKLFRRKMEQMRYPTPEDPHGSHSFWQKRLYFFTMSHAVIITIFIWIYCLWLW